MIKLYAGPVSWFSRKVEIVLYEKALPFTQVLVPFSQTRGYYDRPAELLRINPKHQVPVLIDGALELYDSSIIIEYLDDAYPDTWRAMPNGAALRASARLWEEFADTVMLVPIRKLMHRTEPHDHASAAWTDLEAEAAKAMPQIEQQFDTLDNSLQHTDYLCGEYAAADVACFMAVFWSMRLAGPGFGKRNRLHTWYTRLLARPAIAKVAKEIKAQDEELSAKVEGAFQE